MDWQEEHALVELAFMEAHPAQSNWYRCPCPFCPVKIGKTDKRFSLAINIDTWKYRCWRCHSYGRLPHEPAAVSGMTLVRSLTEEVIVIEPPESFSLLTEEPMVSAESTAEARAYLKKRGVTKEIARECNIGVCLQGRQAGRLIVPVIEPGTGRWQGWVGRVWHSRPIVLRYVYPRGMKRGELLFNQRVLYEETDEPIYVVEGVFDALPHYPRAVACLGKPSHLQKKLLLQTKRPIIVALDGDAWQEAQGLSLWLKVQGRKSGFIRFPPSSDPGNCSPTDLVKLGEAALC
jgi:hypothetical protein